MRILANTVLIIFLAQLIACDTEEKAPEKDHIRGVKTLKISEIENTITRRYPTKLQSTDVSALSFEVSGRLQESHLQVGQAIKAGQVLLSLDPTSLNLAVETAQASLQQSLASASDAVSDLKRQQSLHKQNIVSQAKVDRAETARKIAQAQVQQARKQVESAKDNLAKAKLIAPFDGIIGAINAESYEMINPGTTVISLYKPDHFEAKFGVSLDMVNHLAVGDPAWIEITGSPRLQGVVSAVSANADTVSSFPVTVKLTETSPRLKSGAAVEVVLTVKVNEALTYPLPLSALIIEGDVDFSKTLQQETMNAEVFLYDPNSQTVKRHKVALAGIQGNEILISEGLNIGDRVVVAGIPFLRDGMAVSLLPTSQEQ
ncbi:MAG: hypothetical protein CSA09_04040 [Candidatus Contendobacter odensis]|uniref:Uncharacterized protein n=1 Tax=Candidatus Contendibacter odensensis TaxID=1400860 RepID=A0A2G6PFL9_9GAMM|nr:MAG: hypothetical protein CSA09_04040 [Candidatus Contendobacter odensis]